MNTKDYNNAWSNTPVHKPKFVMTKEVERGGRVYPKGTELFGLDDHNTFTTMQFHNIGLPLHAVKFVGYELYDEWELRRIL